MGSIEGGIVGKLGDNVGIDVVGDDDVVTDNVGFIEGVKVGNVGDIDGKRGCIVGDKVVGVDDGIDVVGDNVIGPNVGFIEGFIEGDKVGNNVGNVGRKVGDNV